MNASRSLHFTKVIFLLGGVIASFLADGLAQTQMNGNYYFAGRVGIGGLESGCKLSVYSPDGLNNVDFIAKITNHDITNGQSMGLSITAGSGPNCTTLAVMGVEGSSNPFLWIRGTGNVGIGTESYSDIKLSVIQENNQFALVTGSDVSAKTRTNLVEKNSRYGMPHYLNAEEYLVLVTGTSDATSGIVNIGGGTSLGNAATDLRFYTAANNVTTTGTERMRISSNGNVGIGTGDTSPTERLEVNGGVKVTGNMNVTGVIRIEPQGDLSMGAFTAEP
jgi:hypothetical protein